MIAFSWSISNTSETPAVKKRSASLYMEVDLNDLTSFTRITNEHPNSHSPLAVLIGFCVFSLVGIKPASF